MWRWNIGPGHRYIVSAAPRHSSYFAPRAWNCSFRRNILRTGCRLCRSSHFADGCHKLREPQRCHFSRAGERVWNEKSNGRQPQQLISYLITESVVYQITALCIAGEQYTFVSPMFSRSSHFNFFRSRWHLLLTLLAIACPVLGIVTGIYPVLLLTRLQPVAVLKRQKALSITAKENPFSLKRVLVTLQFGISVLLIASALIAYRQFEFCWIQIRECIVNRWLLFRDTDQVKDKFEASEAACRTIIVSVSACMEVPSREIRDAGSVLVEGINTDANNAPRMDIQIIDHNFTSLLGLELVAGRNIKSPARGNLFHPYSENYPYQKYLIDQPRRYLINETAMRQLGWKSPEETIGQGSIGRSEMLCWFTALL